MTDKAGNDWTKVSHVMPDSGGSALKLAFLLQVVCRWGAVSAQIVPTQLSHVRSICYLLFAFLYSYEAP